MQRLSGVLMVLAGTALGGYFVLAAPQLNAEKRAETTLLATSAVAATAVSAVSAPTAVASVSAAPIVSAPVVSANGTRTFSPASPLQAPVAASPPKATWTAVVTTEPTANGKLTSSRPGDATTRGVLASDLQRELTRVGCYSGEITSTWTPSAKRAMSAFMDRVNASLPVEEPDYILLTLVQGHTATACGADCPSGQVSSAGGRCVPQAVVAQAAKKTQREDDRRAVEARKAEQQERLAQEQRATEAKRIADARKAADATRVAAAIAAVPAPKPAQRKPAQLTPAQQTAAQQTAAIETEKLPWLAEDAVRSAAADKPVVTASIPTAPKAAPLPGMMSVGGPRQAEPVVPASAAAVTPASGPRPVAAVPAADAPTADADVSPPPAPAKRPVKVASRSNPAAGLPGTKSGPAVRRVTERQPAVRKYRAATIVRRPSPVIVYARKPKPFTYASNNSSSKSVRRGQPRSGTARYNLMMSLGGIY